jgi:effector-binding domain-containing protein
MLFNKLDGKLFFGTLLFVMLYACNNNSDQKETSDHKKDTIIKDTVVKTAVETEKRITPTKAPIINITDTVSIKQLVLCMKDSATSSDRIETKLAQIYGVKLATIIKKNKLKVTGPPMAWYKSQKAPFFFEAGLPVDKKPAKLPAGITIKQIGTDSVVIAHFYGPYELTPQGYTALQDWIKSHKKKIIHPPYEIYIGDPMDKNGKLIDPYKVQTDIVFTWR